MFRYYISQLPMRWPIYVDCNINMSVYVLTLNHPPAFSVMITLTPTGIPRPLSPSMILAKTGTNRKLRKSV